MNEAALREIVGNWADLVSPRTGIIRALSRVQRGAEEPFPPFIYQSEASHFDFRMAKAQDRASAGKGVTEEAAIRGAIGEAIERYCASHVDPFATIVSPWLPILDRAVAPGELVLYSASQYEERRVQYHRWDPKDEVTWVAARELPSDRIVYVPASLVYLQFPQQRVEDVFTPATSNGLAAGPTLDFAILHGLYECMERDAFLATWMARLPATEILFPEGPSSADSIRAHYKRFGVEVRAFRMCTDLEVHVMMAVALDQTGDGPATVVGLGCHASPEKALARAMLEICQVHPGETRRYREQPPGKRLQRAEDVKTLEDHSAWASMPERLDEFSFMIGNGQTQRLEDLQDYSTGNIKRDLEHCVGTLQRAGSRVLYVDLTTSDVIDYGIHVVRAIATGLQPIHFGWGEERLGGVRLFELPHKLGFASATLRESDLNPCPHPLA
ncbi:MAG: YcaO-like family protein [Candidatus Sulfotelmatobacter sp.]|jgi:ribosomal protein S12 methylthiotransferase accessory factor